MADRYLVTGGASVNWNSTASWSATDGGATGASFPVAGDNVFLTAASGAGTLTVNVTSACADLNCTGYTGTLAGSSNISIGGSLTFVAGMTHSHLGTYTFNATAVGKTVTSAGKNLINVTFNGSGGEWTLQDDLMVGGGNGAVALVNGSLLTNGKSVSAGQFAQSTGTFTLTLGASALSLASAAPINFIGGTLTLNAGTSSITCSSTSAAFAGKGLTYHDVTFSNVTSAASISGANTFNNLTLTGGASTNGSVSLSADQTVAGTFTATGNSASNRPIIKSDTAGTARAITAAAVSLQDVDFADVAGAGAASPFTGTRLGDCKGNSGITFTAAANKYYVGNTANWNGAVWATASGGVAAANNFPLPQDTAVLDANSFSADGQTITVNAAFRIGSILCSGTDQAYTLSYGTGPSIFGDVTHDANTTVAGGNQVTFSGRNIQTVTSAGKSWTQNLLVNSIGGTFKLADALTTSGVFSVSNGTLSLNGKQLSCDRYSSSNTNTRAITAASGGITVTGSAETVWSMGSLTGFTLTDALTVTCSYSGAAGTRTVDHGSSGGATAANSPNFSVTAGSDTVTLQAGGGVGDLDFTGFTGTLSNSAQSLFGGLTLASGMSLSAGASVVTFASTSGTKTITSNGKTMDFPVTFGGVGGAWQLADAMTVGSTRTTTLTNGTLDINGKTLSTGRFVSSNSNVRKVMSSLSGGKIATTDTTASATVFGGSTTTNLTVDRTTGTWTIEIGGNTTNVRVVALGGATWPALTFTNTTANGELDFSNTPGTLKSLSVSSPPQAVKFTAAVSYTIEDNNGFPSGTPGNLVTIGSITAASHNLVKSGGGVIDSDYLSISRSTATPANTWYGGATSTDGGNNSGWNFRDPPDRDAFNLFFAQLAACALGLALLMGVC